ncbi:L-asparagine permease [Klebsiella michiganensis]|nr:L-asparagine permease [Klebsiella michiganensis]
MLAYLIPQNDERASSTNHFMDIDRKIATSMNTKHSSVAEQHAAKRHWLNSQESGYHKAMGNRQVQMIAIGGAIGTGLFLGAGRAPADGRTGAGAGLSGLRPLLVLYLTRAGRAGASSPLQRQLRLLRPRVPRRKSGLRCGLDVLYQLGDDRDRRYHRRRAVYALLGRVWRRSAVGLRPRRTGDCRHHEHDRREMVRRDGVLVRAGESSGDRRVSGGRDYFSWQRKAAGWQCHRFPPDYR